MRAEARQHFGEHRLALRRGQRLREIIVAAIAINDGLRQAELFGDRLADRLGIERLVDALRVGPGVLAIAFGQVVAAMVGGQRDRIINRSEEHTSELQSLMRISYAVFCLKQKQYTTHLSYNQKYTQQLHTID